MAHRSYLSPDGKWMMAVEMAGSWLPCRLVPFDGSSLASLSDRSGQCTDAAWSPDGNGCISPRIPAPAHTSWRQRFPDGTPEQVTFGVTEEEGIHFAPDGRSFVTSIGRVRAPSGCTIRAARGRSPPRATPSGRRFLPMVRSCTTWSAAAAPAASFQEDSGSRTSVRPEAAPPAGIRPAVYNISADGQRIVFVAGTSDDALWLAPLNG